MSVMMSWNSPPRAPHSFSMPASIFPPLARPKNFPSLQKPRSGERLLSSSMAGGGGCWFFGFFLSVGSGKVGVTTSPGGGGGGGQSTPSKNSGKKGEKKKLQVGAEVNSIRGR